MIQHLYPLLFLVLILGGAGCQSGDDTTENQNTLPEKPNILFIFADDQSYQTVAALGNPEIRTPALDRLAEEGTAFTRAYNMGGWNGAVCLASRAMLNTGRFLWHAYEVENIQDQLAEQGELWSQMMKKAGYDTYMSGKWHVRTPPEKVFDRVAHERPGMPGDLWSGEIFREVVEENKKENPDYSRVMPPGYNRPSGPDDASWSPSDPSFGGYWEGGKHWSEVLADDGIAFLEEAQDEERPFFMYLAFNAPHDPRQSPQEYTEMYPPENIAVPENFLPQYPYRDEIGCDPSLRDEALAPFPRTEAAVRVHRQEYYAIISHMDHQIGRILEALEKSGKADRTYIFFTADHGLAAGSHGLMGKQNMYEHSMRVPLLVAGPGIAAGAKTEAAVYLQDVMATALELAGMEVPAHVDFHSLMPFLRNDRTTSHYPVVYGAYEKELQRMILKEDYKLIVYPKNKKIRLYHLTEDPLERNDLATDPDFQEKIKELYRELLILQKEMGDPLDLNRVFTDL